MNEIRKIFEKALCEVQRIDCPLSEYADALEEIIDILNDEIEAAKIYKEIEE